MKLFHKLNVIQIDRRTDRQTTCLGNTALHYASRGKNIQHLLQHLHNCCSSQVHYHFVAACSQCRLGAAHFIIASYSQILSFIAAPCCMLQLVRPPGTISSGLAYILPQMFYFVSPRMLRAPSSNRRETLPHGRNLRVFYNASPKIRGALPPKKIGGQKHAKFRSILDHFRL